MVEVDVTTYNLNVITVTYSLTYYLTAKLHYCIELSYSEYGICGGR